MATMDVHLTDVGKRWLQDHYPQGIVWEYDVDKPFKLQAWAVELIELTCLGIPYRIPPDVGGRQPTVKKARAQKVFGLLTGDYMGQEVTRDFLTQLGYGIGYFHHYRRLHSVSIDKSIKAVPEIHSENSGLQIRSIELMLELELVNNAVMYCMDFASVFLALSKPEKGIIKMISSIHETGSGSIKEFYMKINTQDIDKIEIRKLMGYNEFIINPEDEDRYNRSVDRFYTDIKKIAKYFLEYYPIFCAYKHGMNVIPVYNEERYRFAFQFGNPDGSFDYMEMHATWFYGSYEIVEIIFRMFDRLVVPQISWTLIEKMGVDLNKDHIKQTAESTEGEDPTRPLKWTLKLSYPWKIFIPGKPDPFY